MTTKATRPSYSNDTKMRAVHAFLNRGEETIDEVAAKFNTTTSSLYRWQGLFSAAKIKAFMEATPRPSTNGHSHSPIELPPPPVVTKDDNDLRREIAELKEENAELRSLLKKRL